MKCWSCGKDMHRKEDSKHMLFWWCMECGATTVDMVNLGKPLVSEAQRKDTVEKMFRKQARKGKAKEVTDAS